MAKRRNGIVIQINELKTSIRGMENDIPRMIKQLNDELNACSRTQKIVEAFQEQVDVSFCFFVCA